MQHKEATNVAETQIALAEDDGFPNDYEPAPQFVEGNPTVGSRTSFNHDIHANKEAYAAAGVIISLNKNRSRRTSPMGSVAEPVLGFSPRALAQGFWLRNAHGDCGGNPRPECVMER